MTKKRIYSIILTIAICIISVFSLVACNAPKKVQGRYEYTSSSYMQVKASTVDCYNVYAGNVYYEDGTLAGVLTFTDSGIKYDAEEVRAGVYRITAKKDYNNGKVTINCTWDENGGNPRISLAGRYYNKK